MPGYEDQVPPPIAQTTQMPQSEEVALRSASPVGIEDLLFDLAGPYKLEERGNFWNRETVEGKGFYYSFGLVDSVGQWITAGGKLVFALVPDVAVGRHYSDWESPKFTTDLKGIARAKKAAAFYDSVDIDRGSFEWQEYTMGGLQPISKTGWRFTYTRLTPPVFRRKGAPVRIHLWFKTEFSDEFLYTFG